jgi:hypothetical protein
MSLTTTAPIPQGPLSKTDHLEMLKRAIAANLAARTEHDKRQEEASQGEQPELTVISAAHLLGADDNWLYLDVVIRDPVRRALREQLKELGQRLFNLLGTTAGMDKIAEEIADFVPEHWSYRINIIDKAWDGVGKGNDRWWA